MIPESCTIMDDLFLMKPVTIRIVLSKLHNWQCNDEIALDLYEKNGILNPECIIEKKYSLRPT